MSKLQYIFSERWAVRRDALRNLVTLIAPCVAVGRLSEAETALAEKHIDVRCYMDDEDDDEDSDESRGRDVPEGSVMIINLSGILYRWTTANLYNMLCDFDADPNVAGVVLVIDGPGGMAGRVAATADKIRGMSKPVATVVAGEMCSAHLWLGTAAGRVFVSSRHCEIGSLGTMCTFTSFKEYFKKEGIEHRDIYSDSSDLKNREYRDLEENGDDTSTKERLAELHRQFAESVAEYRGIKADMSKPIFRGEVVDGETAIREGFADEIGDIDQAVRWVEARRVISQLPEEYR